MSERAKESNECSDFFADFIAYRDAKCVCGCLWAKIEQLLTECVNLGKIFTVRRGKKLVWFGDRPHEAHHQGPGLAKALFQGSYLLCDFLYYGAVKYHFGNLATSPTTI